MSATDCSDRNTAIKAIRTALKERSSKVWSVRGGTGTAWGWITISAPPKRMDGMQMTAADTAELYALLGLSLHHARAQHVQVADSGDHRREYVARAQGRTPEIIAQPYWD